MDYKQASRIFVIGFIGSDRKGLAEKLAADLNYQLLDLDKEIEKEDGRSILRICMMMGEHEYRNKEYEMLTKCSSMERVVISCGDGVILDEMSQEILKKNAVVIADFDLTAEELWEKARDQKNDLYAFMQYSDESIKKEKFITLYEQRLPLYNQFILRA